VRNAVAAITIRYVGSRIQKIGWRFSSRSRTVPPPIAVNDAMGFRPVERLGEFQKKLAQKGPAEKEPA